MEKETITTYRNTSGPISTVEVLVSKGGMEVTIRSMLDGDDRQITLTYGDVDLVRRVLSEIAGEES